MKSQFIPTSIFLSTLAAESVRRSSHRLPVTLAMNVHLSFKSQLSIMVDFVVGVA